MSDDAGDRAETRELFFHEDDHAKDRVDWFFIGHAILIEGFFSAKGRLQCAVGLLGLASGLIWWFAGWRQLTHLNDLRVRYEQLSANYKAVQDERRKLDRKARWRGRSLGRASPLFYIALPAIFVGFWIFVLWPTRP